MSIETVIALAGLMLSFIVYVIKASLKAGSVDSRLADAEKDIDKVASVMRDNFREVASVIKENHKELMLEIKGVQQDFVTVRRFDDAIAKYDNIVTDSKNDRIKIWDRLDNLQAVKLDKTEHAELCNRGRQ